MNTKQAELTLVQFAEWPNSTMLTDEQLIEGLARDRAHYTDLRGRPMDWAAVVKGYRSYYPDAVGYTVRDSIHQCYGMRYGSEGHQYYSF